MGARGAAVGREGRPLTLFQELLHPAVATMVPEPSTYALTALGLLGVAGAARRRKA